MKLTIVVAGSAIEIEFIWDIYISLFRTRSGVDLHLVDKISNTELSRSHWRCSRANCLSHTLHR